MSPPMPLAERAHQEPEDWAAAQVARLAHQAQVEPPVLLARLASQEQRAQAARPARVQLAAS